MDGGGWNTPQPDCASAVEAVRLLMIDPAHVGAFVQAIPIGGSLFRLREARQPQEDRIDRCFTRNQNGKGKVAIRGRGGNSVRPCSVPRGRPPLSSKPRSPKARSLTPTKGAKLRSIGVAMVLDKAEDHIRLPAKIAINFLECLAPCAAVRSPGAAERISAVTFGMNAGGRDVGRGDDCAERDCREQPAACRGQSQTSS